MPVALLWPAATPTLPPRPASLAATKKIALSAAAGEEATSLAEQASAGGLVTERMRRESWVICWADFGCPPEEDWDGRGGTVSKIVAKCSVPVGSSISVRAALEDALACIQCEEAYCGKRTQAPRRRSCRRALTCA